MKPYFWEGEAAFIVSYAVILRLVKAFRDETKQLPWPPSLNQ